METETPGDDAAQNDDHPAAAIDTIVVDPDDVVDAMRRNHRDQDEQHSHVLRVTTPLQGERRAKPHVSEAHTYYPSELSQKPIHIGPEWFIIGDDAGSRHPDWRNEWAHPTIPEGRSLFRDQFDLYNERGANRPLTDGEEAEWDEWWETVVEIWADRVRTALESTEELTLTSHHPDVDDTTVNVRIEEDDAQ
jgi:hypothetical protein